MLSRHVVSSKSSSPAQMYNQTLVSEANWGRQLRYATSQHARLVSIDPLGWLKTIAEFPR